MTAESNNQSPLRVTHLIEKGFKRIESIDIQPGSKTLIMLQGPNENGKTSAIDGLIAALGGKAKAPMAPVKKGHEFGSVEVFIGDESGPKYRAVRTFAPDGSSSLRLYDTENPDRPSKITAGQTLLDGLIADISFDPLAFMRAESKAQIAMLMTAAGMREKHEELQRQRIGVMESRRDINRIIEIEKQRLATMPRYPNATVKIDEAGIAEKISDAQQHNNRIDELNSKAAFLQSQAEQIREGYKNATESINKEIISLESQISRLREELETRTIAAKKSLAEIKEQHEQMQEAIVAAGEKRTIAEVSKELEQIRGNNEQCDANEARRIAEQELQKKESEADRLTNEIGKIDEESLSLLENSRIGHAVPGLEIREGAIWHNGVPLSQASGMRKLELSTLIGMAGNARLRIMCIDEADKLDDQSLERLVVLAKERNYQLWATAVRIGEAPDDVMILPIRNGTIEPSDTKLVEI